MLLSLARPGMTFLDAGANLGYYTVLLSGIVGPTGHIFAFEPEPQNFLVLAANVLLARQLDVQVPQIHLFRAALSSEAGFKVLQLCQGNLGFHRLTATAPSPNCEVVETLRLDSLFDGTGRPTTERCRPLDLIKADIQGHELPMLQGAETIVATDRPILCLEFEPYIAGTTSA